MDPGSDSSQALADGHSLRRQLGVRDLVLAQILCVAAGLGRARTLMWVAAMAVFYLPMAAVVIALNSATPLEGGLYVWAYRAFGGLGGFLTAWSSLGLWC